MSTCRCRCIEELDNGKKGTSEASRNARQVSRFLNELIEVAGTDKIAPGITLSRPKGLQLRGAQSIGKPALPDRARSMPASASAR